MDRITALLGVELPVIQAPMAGVQDETLALAVAACGGLGSMPCALLDPPRPNTFPGLSAAEVTHCLAGRSNANTG